MISRSLLTIIGLLGLLLTLLPSLLVFNEVLTLAQHYQWMLLGTVLWFGSRIAKERYYGEADA